MLKNKFLYSFFLIGFCLPGCVLKTPAKPVVVPQSAPPRPKPIIVQEVISLKQYPQFKDEARLWDIPFPVATTVHAIAQGNQGKKLVVGYISKLSRADLVAFYRTEMESLGWLESNVFDADYSCLIFNKPVRHCVITVSPIAPRLHSVTIFIGSRKYTEE